MLIVSASRLVEQVNIPASNASGNLLGPREGRQGLNVAADLDATYLKLYNAGDVLPVASAVNWDVFIPAGSAWPGTIGGVVWAGGIAVISPGTPTGRVAAQGA